MSLGNTSQDQAFQPRALNASRTRPPYSHATRTLGFTSLRFSIYRAESLDFPMPGSMTHDAERPVSSGEMLLNRRQRETQPLAYPPIRQPRHFETRHPVHRRREPVTQHPHPHTAHPHRLPIDPHRCPPAVTRWCAQAMHVHRGAVPTRYAAHRQARSARQAAD